MAEATATLARRSATRQELERVLAEQPSIGGLARIPTVDLRRFRANEPHGQILSLETMRRYRAVPLYRCAGTLVVAMENTLDADVIQGLRFIAECRIVAVQATREDIQQALSASPVDPFPPAALKVGPCAGAAPSGKRSDELASKLARDSDDDEIPPLAFHEPEPESDNTLVRLVNRIILEAHQEGASDIHIEPRESAELQVRLRRDGVLRDFLAVPAQYRRALISRIKVMASLDISERRKAQDGKIHFRRFGPAAIELRVATIPLANGLEGVVLRILSSAQALPMDALGISTPALKELREVVEQPHGLVLVCGPTGSGKTTTLHSLLGHLNSGHRKIWTAEDPIEITQKGLCQAQVNPRIGWTFATALRAFLRADPDVIMVGEMRDRETASMAVEASLTGHLVMSTLHTNGAPDAATRLTDMGLDPFSSSDALMGVLAQRLARRICESCAIVRPARLDELELFDREYRADDGAAELAGLEVPDRFAARVAVPVGCAACGHTGYQGRVGLYEWMMVTPALRSLLQRRATAEELRAAARSEGMRTLRQDGIQKALRGLTTLEQVRAVCGVAGMRRQNPARRGPGQHGEARLRVAS